MAKFANDYEDVVVMIGDIFFGCSREDLFTSALSGVHSYLQLIANQFRPIAGDNPITDRNTIV